MNTLLLYFRGEFIELWTLDSNGRAVPVMYNASNKLPLYFLLNGDEILMDNYAKQEYLNGNVKSFGDFWKNVDNNSIKYTRFATEKSFATLLPYVLKESVLPSIIKSHFQTSNLSDFLKSRNTLVAFDSFVEADHREIILKMFFEIIGFEPNSISSIDYFDSFRELQIKRNVLNQTDSFLLTNISDGNFYFHLIGKNSPLHLAKKVLEGKGQDPQLETVLDFLVEIAQAKGSFLNSGDIKKHIINDAKIILNKLEDGLVIHTIKNNNIGVNPLKICFPRNDIEGRLNNRQSLNFIQNEFDLFRRQNNAEQLPLFLSGNVINQTVYREFFKTTYSKVNFEIEDFDTEFIVACLNKNKFESPGSSRTTLNNNFEKTNIRTFLPPNDVIPKGPKAPVLILPNSIIREVKKQVKLPPITSEVKAKLAPVIIPPNAVLPLIKSKPPVFNIPNKINNTPIKTISKEATLPPIIKNKPQ